MMYNLDEQGRIPIVSNQTVQRPSMTRLKNIKMCHVNIQSLGAGEQGPTSIANVKLDQIRSVLQFRHEFDIIGLSETWLNPSVTDEDISLEEYTVFRKDRPQRGGGVCVYVKSSLPCKRRADLEMPNLEIIWVEISFMPKPILVGVTYRSPGMNRGEASDYIQELQDCLITALNVGAESTFLMGDLNDRCTCWESRHEHSELKQDLLETTTALGLHQLINEATYMTGNSANILDLIFTDCPGYVTTAGTLPPIGTSKHAVVYCECTKAITRDKPYSKEIWKYEDADREGLNIAIGDLPFDEILPDDIDEATEIWTHLILMISREYIPCHTVKIHPRDKPWITHEIKKTMKTRDKFYRCYQRTKTKTHYEAYHRVKTEVNIKIIQAKKNNRDKLVARLETLHDSPKQYWSIAKQIYGNRVRSNTPTLIDGETQYSTADEKAKLLAKYFASQSQKPTLPDNYSLPETVISDAPKLEHLHVSEEEVYAELRKLKTGKSPGPDGVSNELLKICSRSLTPSLTKLFNRALNASTFPQLWKQANVSPIHKKGSRQEKENYRPISLLSTVGKILERLIFNKIYAHCETNGLLTWRNSGYKKMDSTTNQLAYIVDKIYKKLDRRRDNCLVFLDQSKAFDRIHHESLKYKMEKLGISGQLLTLLANYLQNRQIRVILDGAKSSWCNISAGVPQGSILGPLLFLIYVNDLIDDLECDIHLYADDAVLMTDFGNDVQLCFEKINRDLYRLNSWAEKWFMSFNPTKTKYMVISSVDKPHPDLSMNGVMLEQVHSYRQLGLIINDRMNWEDHISSAIIKANKKMGLMWRLNNDLPRYAVEAIYLSYIRPQLEYASIIYNNCTQEQSKRLEACQRRAAIACTRAYKRTSTTRLLKELGWPRLETRRTYFSQLLLFKIANNLTPPYLKMLLPRRCNRLRCPLARMSGLQCFNMGHNGHGINLYGFSMTLMAN